MKAAVVSAFAQPPHYEDFPDPVAAGSDELVVDVVAAALHPRVRSQASGSRCTAATAAQSTHWRTGALIARYR